MKKHILVVDDDENTLSLIRGFLKDVDVSIRTTTDGNEGIKLLRTEPPDLAIVDIFMPAKEGIETIMEIRKMSPECQVIAISGGVGQINSLYTLELARKIGAVQTLQKPFSKDEFLEMIEMVLYHPVE